MPFILAMAGCPVPQDQATRVSERLEINPANQRKYWLFVPDTYNPARPMPLIVTCHGTWPFDVANHHIREWKKLAEDYGCIVLAPELSGTDGILGDGPLSAMRANEELILSLISMAGYRFNIDLANIMITGFSGGGFPTYWIGLRNPTVFSCVVLRSGNFSEHNLNAWYSLEAPGGQNILIYWGDSDPITISAQSESGLRYLRDHGFQVSDQLVPTMGHERRPEIAMQFFRERWRAPRPSQPIRPWQTR